MVYVKEENDSKLALSAAEPCIQISVPKVSIFPVNSRSFYAACIYRASSQYTVDSSAISESRCSSLALLYDFLNDFSLSHAARRAKKKLKLS